LRPGLAGGLTTGLLLAGLLTFATAGSSWSASHPVEGALLWLLTGVVIVPVLTLLFLGVAAAVALIVPRDGSVRRPGSVGALVVAGALLAYLVPLWWLRGPRGTTASALFLLGVAILVLMAARWAGLTSAAAIDRRAGRAPRADGTPIRTMALVLVVLIGALFVARVSTAGREGAVAPPEFAVLESAPGLLFIGVAGLDTGVVEGFEPTGTVARLFEGMLGGATFPLQRGSGPEPAEIWTTIVTGMPTTEHGVRSTGEERPAGIAMPLQGREPALSLDAVVNQILPFAAGPPPVGARRARTLWEIAALRRQVAAVGWGASWPAGPCADGAQAAFVVTDRVLPRLLSTAAADRDTWPDGLFTRLEAGFDGELEALRREFRTEFEAAAESTVREPLWESFLIDAFHWRTAEKLRSGESLGALFVYLPGLDILRDRLLPRDRETDVGTLLEVQVALELYVGWLDRLLGAALAEPGEGWQVMLVADPGRHAHAEVEGFVVVSGPRARGACVGPVLDPLDAAPLALNLMGFPGSGEMKGRLPGACIEEISLPQRQVAGFGRRGTQEGPATGIRDAETLERLESLGYLD
jgi:hypothetical protein